MNYLKVCANRFGSLFAALVVLGCVSSQSIYLDYRPVDGQVNKYRADVLADIQLDSILWNDTIEKTISGDFQISVESSHSVSGDRTSARLKTYVDDLDFGMGHGCENTAKAWLNEDIEFSENEDGVWKANLVGNQDDILTNRDIDECSDETYKLFSELNFQPWSEMLTVLPPKLKRVLGSKLSQPINDTSKLTYEVSHINDRFMRIKIETLPDGDASAEGSGQLALDVQALELMPYQMEGWADYDVETGTLKNMRVQLTMNIETQQLQGKIKALIVVREQPLIDIRAYNMRSEHRYEYTTDEFDEELFNKVDQKLAEQSIDIKKVDWEGDRIALSLLQTDGKPLHIMDYQVLDKNKRELDYVLTSSRNNMPVLYADIDPRIEKESGLSQPAYIRVNSRLSAGKVESSILPIVDDKVAFSNEYFTITGEKKRSWGGTYWDLTVRKMSDGLVSAFSFANEAQDVEVDISREFDNAENNDSHWLDIISENDVYRVSVVYQGDEFDTLKQGLKFSWQFYGESVSTDLALPYSVKAVGLQKPTESKYNSEPVSVEQDMPILSVNKYTAYLEVPRSMFRKCNLTQVVGEHQSSPMRWVLSEKSYDSKVFQLSAHEGDTRALYGAQGQIDIDCSEVQLQSLEQGQDYEVLQPWLIRLKGKYADLDMKTARKHLQPYDDSGKVIDWVEPAKDADFDSPTLKAWGDISEVKWIEFKEPKQVITRNLEFDKFPYLP